MNTIKEKLANLSEDGKYFEACLVAGEYIKQLEDGIDEVRQTQDMLYDEHYDLQAWRDNHIVTETIFNKILEEK